MLIRTLAIEHQPTRLLGILRRPASRHFDTPASAPFQSAVPATNLSSTAHATDALVAVVDAIRMEHSGGFFAQDGAAIPW